MMEDYLTIKQLAARWGISRRTLEKWHRNNVGPPAMKLGGKVFFKKEDVTAYERHQRKIQRFVFHPILNGISPTGTDDQKRSVGIHKGGSR